MKIHGNVKCDCGHKQKDHHLKTGFCHDETHKNSGQCGCTWFHPNMKYIYKKKKNQK